MGSLEQTLPGLTLQHVVHSKVDFTQKHIYTLHRESGDTTIEVSVIDKRDGKKILCLPSQTNCSQACRFCHTRMLAGKVATTNLTRFEIEKIARQTYLDAGLSGGTETLLVSFMGVGEPLANPELISSMVLMRTWAMSINRPIRFALATMLPKEHTGDFFDLSYDAAVNDLKLKVHLSLHYTTDDQRAEWMPTAAPIEQSLHLLHDYHRVTMNPVEIHYTLIKGVNDWYADGNRLRELLHDYKIPVKILHYNPIPGDPHEAPDPLWVEYFRSELEAAGIDTEWYDSPGADISAACGMFSTDVYVPAFMIKPTTDPEGGSGAPAQLLAPGISQQPQAGA
jgi:23S rRNA (adenine2503-C2)-methyltransferase